MKKRLKEMEEEASALRDMQAKVEKEMGGSRGSYIFTCSHFLTGMH
jgi:polyadenylate-binding protein 2